MMAAFDPGFNFIFFARGLQSWYTPFFLFCDQMPDFHLALAFDRDLADIFTLELILDQFVRGAGDLDFADRALAFHAAGRIDHIAP